MVHMAWLRRWRLGLLVWIVAGLAVVLMPVKVSRAQVAEYNVLMLNSYHHGLNWTDGIVAAAQDVIFDPETNPVADRTELYLEYMDTKRLPMDETVEAAWATYLERKYADVPLDVIMVSDNNGYDFLRRYRDTLFPDVPVVFCGVNFFQPEDLAGLERFTGVVEQMDPRSTIEVALDLHPDTRRIYVISDQTTTGRLVQQQVNEVVPVFEGRVTFEMLTYASVADLEQLRDLPDDTLVLLVVFNRDQEGNFYDYRQGMDLLLSITDRPIYGVWDFYLDLGLVGGMLTNAGLQGSTAAEMVVQILNGADARGLPVVEQSPNRYMFDFEQLRRFDISPAEVPQISGVSGARTVIINQPLPFLERYGLALGSVAGVIVITSGIFVLQRNNLRKQRLTEVALRESNQALEEARASMEAEVTARTNDLRERSLQFQTAAVVASEAAGIRDIDSLMRTIGDLLAERFKFYHVGIFLVEEAGEYAVLRYASSEGGKQLVARGHRLRVGQEGIVGYVSSRGEARIALDVTSDETWRNTPELSHTRSEMAVPLKVQDTILGVLDVQSEKRAAFDREDIAVVEIVADQLALGIQNARLFEESRETFSRLQTAYGERLNALWTRFGQGRVYRYDGFEIKPTGEPAAREVGDGRISVPILVRGQIVGTIDLERDSDEAPWMPEERELASSIGLQAGLSLENARLLSESQSRAQRERIISDITAQMRETLDMDLILQTALREMGDKLGIPKIEVQLWDTPSDRPADLDNQAHKPEQKVEDRGA